MKSVFTRAVVERAKDTLLRGQRVEVFAADNGLSLPDALVIWQEAQAELAMELADRMTRKNKAGRRRRR